MGILQEFKQLMAVGNTVKSDLGYGEERPRKVLGVSATKCELEGVRENSPPSTHNYWPKASQLSKEDNKFVITDDYGWKLKYWKA